MRYVLIADRAWLSVGGLVVVGGVGLAHESLGTCVERRGVSVCVGAARAGGWAPARLVTLARRLLPAACSPHGGASPPYSRGNPPAPRPSAPAPATELYPPPLLNLTNIQTIIYSLGSCSKQKILMTFHSRKKIRRGLFDGIGECIKPKQRSSTKEPSQDR